jgi:hypothetical protein
VKKVAQNVAQPIISPILTHYFHCEKTAKKFRPLTSFKKVPKENTRPIGENSPNFVTLARIQTKTVLKSWPLTAQFSGHGVAG